VLARLAPSSQTVGFYTENPLASKARQMNLEKNEFGGFASMEKHSTTSDQMHSAKSKI